MSKSASQKSTVNTTMLRYVAVELPDATPEQVQCLTSHVMQWRDDVWLMDLAPVWSYWQRQAACARMDVRLLWRQVLQRALHPESLAGGVIPLQSQFRAVAATHPWLGLLLLKRMRERRLSGFLTQHSDTATHLWRDMSWDIWWECADDVAHHLEHGGAKKFRAAAYRQEKAKFMRAVRRLNLGRAVDMKHVSVEEIRRRFGFWWAEIWNWTWQAPSAEDLFPWNNWKYPQPPHVTRHLDEALWHWPNMQDLLRDDFDRLSERLTERHRVQVLRWDWVRSDASTESLFVRFRHPHALHQERGAQQTALLQAFYQFEAWQRQQASLEEEGIIPPYIVSWRLAVEQSLILQPMIQDLFAEMNEEQEGEQALSRLENELPIPLQRFDYGADWLPENSSVPLGMGVESASRGSYEATARRRPLFLYRTPQPLKEAVLRHQFLESVGERWWNGVSALERQYFRITTPQQQNLWAFRDAKGAWWVHGIFA